VDAQTNLFVADSQDYLLRKLSRGGTNWLVTTIGGQANFWGSSDGTATQARFNTPSGVTIDAAGNLYIADTLNNSMRRGTVHTVPFLEINRAASDVVLSWPSWAVDYTLQTTTGLSLSDYWADVSGGTVTGNNFFLTNAISGDAAFYRLNLP
jgi:hypothetical protein